MHNVVKYRRASVLRGARRRWAWAVRAWATCFHLLRIVESHLGLKKLASTVGCFLIFLFLLPVLLVLYSAIKCWRVGVGVWAVWAVEGVEEMAGVTVRGAMESSNRSGIQTLLLNLSGTPSLEHIRRKIMEEVVERRGRQGERLYPNLRRRLGTAGRYEAWLRHNDFHIDQHVTLAPQHYQGRLLTSRNIQEYVNEVVSQPLSPDLPPWHVTLIVTCDGGSGGEGETWVVARAHHLLADSLSLPDLLVEALPDPWLQPAARGHSLLAAPTATSRLTDAAFRVLVSGLVRVARVCALPGRCLLESVLMPGMHLLEEAAQVSKKMGSEMFPVVSFMVYLVSVLGRRVTGCVASVWADVLHRLSLFSLRGAAFCCVVWALRLWWSSVVVGLLLPFALIRGCFRVAGVARRVVVSEEFKLVVAAAVEMYWMVRAFVSLPRLVLESVRVGRKRPLIGWPGQRRNTRPSRWASGSTPQGGVTVAWSDPVPLSTVRGVHGATGATPGEVLLTAVAGAVRDYLRVMGLPMLEEVSCTVPVYSQRWAESRPSHVNTPGLVPLTLPTSAADSSSALCLLRQSLKDIRDYPERYLASVWLIRNVSYFLPVSLLGTVFRTLSSHYPIFMSSLAGPQQPVTLWGHEVLNVFHWRPPCDGAVLSVCVTSYRGEALLGVVADSRVVPSAASLPQAFVTHLNELAVDVGVKLERQNYTWFRSVTPPPSPSLTPPSTPTLRSPSHPFSLHRRPVTSPAIYGRKFSRHQEQYYQATRPIPNY